jgi:nickel-dependent lactate racemase
LKVLKPNDVPSLRDASRSVEEAVRNPIGTRRLREIIRKEERVCIIINDITRPVPNDQILPVVLRELSEGGIQEDDTVIVIANGVHRANNPDEIRELVENPLFNSLNVHNHDAFDSSMITTVGKTRDGIPISLNSRVAQAQRRILIGMVTPHHGAGYSGGRKSIFPGVSSYETLKMLHGVEPIRPMLGVLKGNPLHKNSLEAARVGGADFIVNTIPNMDGETYAIVAGHMVIWKRHGSRELFSVIKFVAKRFLKRPILLSRVPEASQEILISDSHRRPFLLQKCW